MSGDDGIFWEEGAIWDDANGAYFFRGYWLSSKSTHISQGTFILAGPNRLNRWEDAQRWKSWRLTCACYRWGPDRSILDIGSDRTQWSTSPRCPTAESKRPTNNKSAYSATGPNFFGL